MTESNNFHNLPWLSRLVWNESHTSLVQTESCGAAPVWPCCQENADNCIAIGIPRRHRRGYSPFDNFSMDSVLSRESCQYSPQLMYNPFFNFDKKMAGSVWDKGLWRHNWNNLWSVFSKVVFAATSRGIIGWNGNMISDSVQDVTKYIFLHVLLLFQEIPRSLACLAPQWIIWICFVSNYFLGILNPYLMYSFYRDVLKCLFLKFPMSSRVIQYVFPEAFG